MKIQTSEVVNCPNRPHICAVKSQSSFGGADMWNVKFHRPDGIWKDLQWMSVCNVEDLFCLPSGTIQRYKVRGEYVVKPKEKKVKS